MKFERWLLRILASPFKKRTVIGVTLLAFVGSLWMFPSQLVKAKMLPGKSADTFSVYVDLPKGSSHVQTSAVTQCVTSLLSLEPHVRSMSVYAGMGAPLDYAGLVKGSGLKRGEHVAEIVVNLTDKTTREEASFALVHRVRPVVQHDCEPLVEGTRIKMVEEPAGPPTLAAIVVELYGENDALLRELNAHVQEVLRGTPGLVDVDTLEEAAHDTFTLEIDAARVLSTGVDLKQVHDIVYLAYEGTQVAAQNRGDSYTQVPLFLRLDAPHTSLHVKSANALHARLASLHLHTNTGALVPVSELVRIVPSRLAPTLFSKNLRRMHTVVAETDLVSQVYPLLEARSRLKEVLGASYTITNGSLFDLKLVHKATGEPIELVWDGEMKVTMDTFADLGGAFIAALVVIFLLMVVYYKSFALGGIILLGSFLSIIGVIVGHWIMDIFTHTTFFLTATSLIGFIALMGINSRNSLLIIDFAKSMMDAGMPKRNAIAHSAATRAKPIFLTAITVVLASAMLALDPIFGGLGVALIFGTMASVIVSLVFVPVLLDQSPAI
ncbi:MAG: efflux RND transporter permease subunit [Campylobacterales bacterium]|nr:efflux RND transporter permease subunit [Campylobacterales bacterium]